VAVASPGAAGAGTGSGIGPTRIDRVIGIAKAFTTRVGEGPFPGELLDEVGDRIRDDGGEFGTTTGRPRRIGWFDALVVEQAVRVNAVTDVVLTKLDTLTGWDRVRIVVGYEIGGVRHDVMPLSQTDIHHAQPIYEDLPGWNEDLSGCRSFGELPAAAQAYVRRIEELIGCRISGIGVGPGREQWVSGRCRSSTRMRLNLSSRCSRCDLSYHGLTLHRPQQREITE